MKIIMILGTGVLLTFPVDRSIKPDCFSQGHAIMEKIAFYNDGWILKGSNIEIGGWYCHVSKGK